MNLRRITVAVIAAAISSVTLGCALILAAPQARTPVHASGGSKPTSANAGEQILEFPRFSMGKLYLRRFTDPISGSSWDKHKIGEAQGEVRLPADARVRLELSYAGCEDPAPLLSIKSPALAAIDLRDLENCDDKTMGFVGRISSLTDVNCAGADVGNAGVAKLLALKNLDQLDIQKTLVTGDGLATVGKMTKLVRLAVGYNQLTDDSLKYLEPLQELHFLYIPACQLSDKCLVHIAKLRKLNHLELFNNQKISSKGMDMLATLPDLRTLTLDGTFVDEKA
ncbi:MAG TPA: hypothetical protein V6C69_11785, partial [Trichormus sp.]